MVVNQLMAVLMRGVPGGASGASQRRSPAAAAAADAPRAGAARGAGGTCQGRRGMAGAPWGCAMGCHGMPWVDGGMAD